MSISSTIPSVSGNTLSNAQAPICDFHQFLRENNYDYNELEKYLEIPQPGQGYGPQYHLTGDNWGSNESINGLICVFEHFRDSHSAHQHRESEVKYRFTELAYGISLWAVGRQSDDFKKLAGKRNVSTVLQPGENQFLPVVRVLWGPRAQEHDIPVSKIWFYDQKHDSLANVLNQFYHARLHPRDVKPFMKGLSRHYKTAYDALVMADKQNNK